jgi:hypothetical protein
MIQSCARSTEPSPSRARHSESSVARPRPRAAARSERLKLWARGPRRAARSKRGHPSADPAW